jgi:hypothetical protein
MSLTRPSSWLAAVIAVLSLAAGAHAQEFHSRLNPFVELDEFGTRDFQYFAPADITDFGGIDPPRTGFYFVYDRLYINTDRPNGVPSQGDGNDGDFGWGNRFDGGFWTEENVGWGFSATHLDGPNVNLVTFQERVSRFNEDDDPPGSGGEPILQDRNPRRYNVTQSINDFKFSSVELNRMWRRKQFHNGAVLEPFLGIRYMTLKDFGRRETYHRYAENTVGDEVVPTDPRREGPYEDYLQDFTTHENSMLGGQLGVRLHKQAGHWLLSGEFRAFAVQNFQYYTHRFERTLTRGDLESDVDLEIHEQTIDHDYNEEFVWGGEVRTEAAYQLTRSISLRMGLSVTNLGQGISRGVVERASILAAPLRFTDNDQSVTMAGVTFGVDINR